MAENKDYLLAVKLQKELNSLDEKLVKASNKRKHHEEDALSLNATQNIVHPEWETIDPTPDIYSLFGAFDIKFFQGKLKCVELEWSKRMYQCAGICYQRKNQLGMSIIIRLSEPLLKLRSRRNLIETLLHEMIHAYLFILHIRESNGGHGPNFIRIMNSINKTAGTNITVYHSFHDEVELYRTHVWRCNGICQHRKPFYGWIRRTSNRAPSANDFWWAKHQQTCSGHFQKVSEPEPKRKITKKSIESTKDSQIKKWCDNSVYNPKGINFTRKPDLNQTISSSRTTPQDNVRKIWSSRFESKTIPRPQSSIDLNKTPLNDGNNQKSALHSPVEQKYRNLDNDILIQTSHRDIINISDEEENDNKNNANVKANSNITIKQELMDDIGEKDSIIELIDDEYDDELRDESFEILSDKSVIDDIFGTDTLLSDFDEINNVVMNDPENYGNPDKEIIMCPICQDQMPREQLSNHLDGCTGITVKIEKKKKENVNAGRPKTLPYYKNKPARTAVSNQSLNSQEIDALRAAGYNEGMIEHIKNESEEYNRRILGEMEAERKNSLGTTVGSLNERDSEDMASKQLCCPNCDQKVNISSINGHLDNCLLSPTPAESSTVINSTNTTENSFRAPNIVKCPICSQQIESDKINEHIDNCLIL